MGKPDNKRAPNKELEKGREAMEVDKEGNVATPTKTEEKPNEDENVSPEGATKE